ncbi:hypothetical protein CALVIDRAFT_569899 [Calocera viscosa TUFC12733]|uniref:Uncharacterized protein n=1 Tax=Calocera viscosa (strain TUFC12733) TaxID=1330018 RepID=A0A167FGK7_CALVF|nr:hypothetical protein CALVIDRAFT_569899 [Calocera viscosa TUFC12733]
MDHLYDSKRMYFRVASHHVFHMLYTPKTVHDVEYLPPNHMGKSGDLAIHPPSPHGLAIKRGEAWVVSTGRWKGMRDPERHPCHEPGWDNLRIFWDPEPHWQTLGGARQSNYKQAATQREARTVSSGSMPPLSSVQGRDLAAPSSSGPKSSGSAKPRRAAPAYKAPTRLVTSSPRGRKIWRPKEPGLFAGGDTVQGMVQPAIGDTFEEGSPDHSSQPALPTPAPHVSEQALETSWDTADSEEEAECSALDDLDDELLEATFYGYTLDDLPVADLKANATKHGNDWLLPLFDKWTECFKALTTSAKQGTATLKALMQVAYHIEPHSSCQVDRFLHSTEGIIRPSMAMVMEDMLACRDTYIACKEVDTGRNSSFPIAQVMLSLLHHSAGYMPSSDVPSLGIFDLPAHSPQGLQLCQMKLPEDYTPDWSKVAPGPNEPVTPHTQVMPASAVADWCWNAAGTLNAFLHFDAQIGSAPHKLWLFAPSTPLNRKLMRSFMFNNRPHDHSARIIPALEGITYMLVTPSSKFNAGFIAPGEFYCVLTFELSAHATFKLYDLRHWKLAKKVMLWELQNLSNWPHTDEGRNMAERLQNELDRWFNLGADPKFLGAKLRGLQVYLKTFPQN